MFQGRLCIAIVRYTKLAKIAGAIAPPAPPVPAPLYRIEKGCILSSFLDIFTTWPFWMEAAN